jgi:hypothetical protein
MTCCAANAADAESDQEHVLEPAVDVTPHAPEWAHRQVGDDDATRRNVDLDCASFDVKPGEKSTCTVEVNALSTVGESIGGPVDCVRGVDTWIPQVRRTSKHPLPVS